MYRIGVDNVSALFKDLRDPFLIVIEAYSKTPQKYPATIRSKYRWLAA